jgi:acyl-coenzyme A thioesterase PaaI-like protein
MLPDSGSAPLTVADGAEILADNFAPWIQDLGLTVEEVGRSRAVLRLPWSVRLARDGGTLCGQALMAAADTATVIAVAAARGGYGPMTTIQQSTTFQRSVADRDVLVDARVTKLSRALAFTDVVLKTEGAADFSAHSTVLCALL